LNQDKLLQSYVNYMKGNQPKESQAAETDSDYVREKTAEKSIDPQSKRMLDISLSLIKNRERLMDLKQPVYQR